MLRIRRLISALCSILILALAPTARAAQIPQVGEPAPNFTLQTLEGQAVSLRPLTAQSPVILVVLRGWPGYQCPLCTKQVHDFVEHAEEFRQHGVKVLMVYPGPAAALAEHAQDFLKDKSWPAEFTMVIDPGYTFTNQYGLRWSAPKETAYPSTFVIGTDGKVAYSHVSHTHGDRVGATAALKAVLALQ